MRQEFKVWHQGIMYPQPGKGMNIIMRDSGMIILERNTGMMFSYDYEVLKDAILLLYTGRKDITYRKIFESDIVIATRILQPNDGEETRHTYPPHQVKWDENLCSFNLPAETNIYDGKEIWEYEIIGNAYKNPELIPNESEFLNKEQTQIQ